MTQPFLGEIRMFAGTYAPSSWSLCDGGIINVNQNEPLFSVLGSTYGGDGRNTFALPDLRGRLPMHYGQGTGLTNHPIGEKAGNENVTITSQQMTSHTHTMSATNVDGDSVDPSGRIYGAARGSGGSAFPLFADEIDTTLNSGVIGQTGGTTARNNIMPFLCLNFIIALNGLVPSQT